MELRWLIVLAIYTLMIGPIVNIPSGDANARSNPVRAAK